MNIYDKAIALQEQKAQLEEEKRTQEKLKKRDENASKLGLFEVIKKAKFLCKYASLIIKYVRIDPKDFSHIPMKDCVW